MRATLTSRSRPIVTLSASRNGRGDSPARNPSYVTGSPSAWESSDSSSGYHDLSGTTNGSASAITAIAPSASIAVRFQSVRFLRLNQVAPI